MAMKGVSSLEDAAEVRARVRVRVRVRVLANPNPNPNPNPDQVTATSDDVVLMSLDRATFTSLLGSLQAILNREAAKRHKEAEKARKPVVLMKDLEQRTILGVGTFGRVKLVRHNSP